MTTPGHCRCRPYPYARFAAGSLVLLYLRHRADRCGLPPEVLDPRTYGGQPAGPHPDPARRGA